MNVGYLDFPLLQRATFQVIIATDGYVTYAVSGYRTVWTNTNVFNRPFVQSVHSQENGVQSNVIVPSKFHFFLYILIFLMTGQMRLVSR